jgi:ribosome-binding protein aMBF1 (putative translation factor)
MDKPLKDLKKHLLRDPEARIAYDTLDLEFRVARMVIGARSAAGLTQQELADRMQTKQSVVARLEGGGQLPSLTTLQKIAQATGQTLTLEVTP